MSKIMWITGIFLLVSVAVFGENRWTLSSPDKSIVVTLMYEDQRFFYQIGLQGNELLKKSPLGIWTDGQDFTKNIHRIDAALEKSEHVAYTTSISKVGTVSNVYNCRTFRMENVNGEFVNVVFRVGNYGIAYAYQFDAPKVVMGESSGFVLPAQSKAFLTPLSKAKSGWCETNPSYEDHYQCGVSISTLSDYRQGWVFPALFEVENAGWLLLSETGVDENYVASHLSESEMGMYQIEFPHPDHNLPADPANAIQKTTAKTPWRVIMLGDELNDIVSSTLAQDLVIPLYQPHVDFRLGMSSWSWLVYNDSSTTFEKTKEFIDLSSTLRFPYCLIDAQWDVQIGREKMEELANYARNKKVDLLLWYNSNGNWNSAPQTPKNLMNNPEARRKEMEWLSRIGIRGIKVDFFGGDKQSGMQLYDEILQDANLYGIACIFHGCTLPRGWDRMYPNFVTAEAVMGQEFCKADQDNENLRPKHCTILPFTRNVVAPMDFTPTVLNEYLGEHPETGARRVTTAAFELALPVIFYSPITHLGIVPENLKDFPSYVWEYLSGVPTVWDRTQLLSGYPGNEVVMARQKNGIWYIAGINGENRAKEISVDLSFMPNGANATLLINENNRPNAVKRQRIRVNKNEKLQVCLQAYDGFVLFSEE